jgi:hypothetical protein
MATIKELVSAVKKILANEDDSLYAWALHPHVLNVVAKHLPRNLLSSIYQKHPTNIKSADGVYECNQNWCRHNIFGCAEKPVKRCAFQDCASVVCEQCHKMFLGNESDCSWKCRSHSLSRSIAQNSTTSSHSLLKNFLVLLDIDECILKMESRITGEFPIRPADLVFDRIQKDGSRVQIRAWWRSNLEYLLKGLEDIGGVELRIFSASDCVQVELVIKQLKIAFPLLRIVQNMPEGKFSSRSFHPEDVDMKSAIAFKNLSLLFQKESSLSIFVDAYRSDATFLVIDDSPDIYMKTNDNYHQHVIGIEKFQGDSPVKNADTSALKEAFHIVQEVILRYRSQADDDSNTGIYWPVRALLRRVLEERDDAIERSKQLIDIRIRSIKSPKKQVSSCADTPPQKRHKHE